jgi:hypothetical protein
MVEHATVPQMLLAYKTSAHCNIHIQLRAAGAACLLSKVLPSSASATVADVLHQIAQHVCRRQALCQQHGSMRMHSNPQHVSLGLLTNERDVLVFAKRGIQPLAAVGYFTPVWTLAVNRVV